MFAFSFIVLVGYLSEHQRTVSDKMFTLFAKIKKSFQIKIMFFIFPSDLIIYSDRCPKRNERKELLGSCF